MRFLMKAALAAAAVVLCSVAAFAGDFEKSFNVTAGGSVRKAAGDPPPPSRP